MIVSSTAVKQQQEEEEEEEVEYENVHTVSTDLHTVELNIALTRESTNKVSQTTVLGFNSIVTNDSIVVPVLYRLFIVLCHVFKIHHC